MHKDCTSFQEHFAPTPVNGGFQMEGYWVWDGGVIKGEDGKYHMFASRWPKTLPLHPGWCVASEIVRAVSDQPEGPFEFAEVVLSARGAQYWDGRSVFNSVIHKHEDTYVLFYVGSTHPFGEIPTDGSYKHQSYQFRAARSNKRIGIATSKSVFGPWERRDKPLFEPSLDGFDNFFTSNPAPCINPDGSCLLVYKTRTYLTAPFPSDEIFSDMKLGVAYAERYDGEYRRLKDSPLFSEEEGILEDPCIWKMTDGYGMIAKDWAGTYTGDKGSVVCATSPNGVDWTMETTSAFSRDILWDNGKVRTMGNMDRPYLVTDGDELTHLVVATTDAPGADFCGMDAAWNVCIPLK